MATSSTQTIKLDVSEGVSVTAKIDAPEQMTPSTPGLLLAHGANNDLDYPLLVSVATALAREAAVLVLRFNFPYAQRGTTSRDARPVLEQTFRSAYDTLVRDLLSPSALVFVGGKSLGGRFAAEFVSGAVEGEPLPASGLVVLGYPLHAPGRQDKPNLTPLEHIDIPSLFFAGTRDQFCAPQDIEPILAGLAHPGRLVVVEGGDHSFLLPKSSGRPADDAYETIAAETAAFISEVTTASRLPGP